MRIFVPLLLIGCLLSLLSYQLFHSRGAEIPSALVGEKIPYFSLTVLENEKIKLSPKTFNGQVILLNFWATWCSACVAEHQMLNKIAQEYHVPIYSILYKDDAQIAQAFLSKSGNPFRAVGLDKTGDAGIDFGIYGTPETFVISPQGKIIYRQVGVIDQTVWDSVLAPLIARYEVKPNKLLSLVRGTA